MKTAISRRSFNLGIASATVLQRPATAQTAPIRFGLLTVKTGPLAQGGIQMEQGLTTFLKQRDYKVAGRKVELIVADTGGNPAGAITKVAELVERDRVDIVFGPLASFELLAITDYIIRAKMPLLAHAGTDECTQRNLNPYLVRQTPTSSQSIFPLADYAANELKFGKVATITEDFAFGYEQIGGFQRVFETDRGRVVQKFWPPLVTPDYTPYLAQIGQLSGIDALVAGFAGSNPVKFMSQYADQGLELPVLGGQAMGDDALLKTFGDDAVGMINSCPYTDDFKSDMNKQFVADVIALSGNVPGFYAADMYVHGMVAEAGLKKVDGETADKMALVLAMRSANLQDTPRGPVRFDHLGQGIGNIFIRKIEKANGKLVNVTLKTYEGVSQFWNFDEGWYLKQPAYSRNYPPIKH